MLETKVNINNLLKPDTPHNIFCREEKQGIPSPLLKMQNKSQTQPCQ